MKNTKTTNIIKTTTANIINETKGEIAMKKTNLTNTITVIVAVALMAVITLTAFGLCGCSQQSAPATEAASAATTASATAAPAAQAPATQAPETAAPAQQNNAGVTMDDAINTAVTDAGFSVSDVQITKQKLDTDDGVQKYEIEFIKGDYEYEYDINAQTGAIMEKSYDSVYDD